MSFESTPARVLRQGRLNGDRPAYHVFEGGAWRATSWRRYAQEVREVGRALMALGLEPGQAVNILGFNRPEWTIFDVGAMAVGGAPAGIYTTCSSAEVAWIIQHSGAPVVLVEDAAQWEKIRQRRQDLPGLRHVVTMRGAGPMDDDMVLTWAEFVARGEAVDDAAFDARLDALEADQLASMIYTSGTTGPPKGVMLSHKNLTWTADTVLSFIELGPENATLSYLPLSHIAEQMFTVHAAAATGYQTFYAESIERLLDNLKDVQPTIFFGVPRIWEKFHAGLSAKMAEATGVKAALLRWALKVGAAVSACGCRGDAPGASLALQHRLANKLVFSKVKEAVGLGRVEYAVTGAAPVSREILEFFASLDLLIFEVYGQSEGSGPTTFNRPGATRMGSVGQPIPGCEVRIAEDGEIMVRGDNVFIGYFKDEAATAEAITDGWMHSGDLGKLDAEGFLHITGRKKDIIITAGGKNIAPKLIEAALKDHELVNEAVVIGDRRKYLAALLTLEPEAAERWAHAQGTSTEGLHENTALLAVLQAHVDAKNADFARVEQIKRFAVLPRQLSMEEGELTPTLKVKRKVVHEHFADAIEGLYA
ncbi:MAG: long-chain fatty acid--CoA ligase [Alphaproteobacteria bacterium]|nr:long-chain fatty acid--CoA ligase [Alphaproteobacteria bacterium]